MNDKEKEEEDGQVVPPTGWSLCSNSDKNLDSSRLCLSVIASFLVFKETHIPIILVAQPSNCDSIPQNSFYDQILFKEESLHDIRRGGFTSVWLPPVCKSVQWQGYLPGGLYDIDSFYGSLTQLQRLVKLLKEHGLQVWIDWPVKRRCLREQDPSHRNHMYVTKPIWTVDCLQSSSSSMKNNAATCNVGYPKLLMSTNMEDWLDMTIPVHLHNPKVRQDLIQWTKWLSNQLGMDGLVCDGVESSDVPFLLDWIKHSTTREEISSCHPSSNRFQQDVVSLVQQSSRKNRNGNTPHSSFISIALVKVECSVDSQGRLAYDQTWATDRLMEFIESTNNHFALVDTVTRAILEAAVVFHEYWRLIDKEARVVGLLGRRSDRAITTLNMVDLLATPDDKEEPKHIFGEHGYYLHPASTCAASNHSHSWRICKTQRYVFPEQHILKGYAYLLTHPGIPCVHWVSILWRMMITGNSLSYILIMRIIILTHDGDKVSKN